MNLTISHMAMARLSKQANLDARWVIEVFSLLAVNSDLCIPSTAVHTLCSYLETLPSD